MSSISLGLLITINANSFPLPPRLSANGYASDYTVGEADLMFPMAGDLRHNFYLDPSVAYGTDNQGYADLGLGYRWIKNDAAILGLYLFGGYTRIDNNARLWVANPGIEALGSRWDAHLNAYFPMGDRNYALGNVLGSFSFTEHSELASVFPLTQHAGNGVDLKLRYQLFPYTPLTGYVGSYFFNPKQTSNVLGGAAGLEYWIDSNVKIFASYTYDSLHHSTGAFGLGVELGGTHTERINPTLEERITDPVERYLSELGIGSAIPSRRVQGLTIGQAIISNNIAFFAQTGAPDNGGVGLTLANCTFENPCGPSDLTDLGASTLSTLLPNTQMYFNGGAYDALDVVGGTNAVTLQAGQRLSSRTADYSETATGAGRSIFNGAFTLSSNNALNDIVLLPTEATIANGIMTTNGINDLIIGSQIGSEDNRYTTGVIITNGQLNIINSSVFGRIRGIRDQNTSSLLIQNSQVNAMNTAGGATGISLSANSTTMLDNTQVIATAPGSASGNVFGINALNTSQVTIINASTITANLTGVQGSSVGLIVDATSSAQQMIGGTLSVSGTGVTTLLTQGSIITLTGVTCLLNGVPTAC